ncbi:MAG: hypothetical protein FWF09_07420 [Bacteroidales bacterium]|nr:hypothetical protein [Bacteroidales bacterium]
MIKIKRKSTVTTLCAVMIGLFFAVGCKKDEGKKENNSNLTTIVNDNFSWATLLYVPCPEIWCNVRTQYVYFEGDSIVGDIVYRKVFSCSDKLHENIKCEGLIREQREKTYFIPYSFETEYLLYDFSLEAGMMFEYKYWDFGGTESATFFVSFVDFVEINGAMKKRIQIKASSDDEWVVDTWIEEIGSMSGILYPCYQSFLDGEVKSLLCCYQSNELIYKNPVYSECYYDNLDDIKK